MGRVRVKIIKKKVVVRRRQGTWQRVGTRVVPGPAQQPSLPDLPPLYNQPSLLLLGLPGGNSRSVWQQLWKVSRLWSPIHPRANGEIFRPEQFGVAPLYLQYTNGDDAYQIAESELLKYPRGFLLHDITQPHLVARFIQQHPGYFRVVLLDEDCSPVTRAELTPLANEVLPYSHVLDRGELSLHELLTVLAYPPP